METRSPKEEREAGKYTSPQEKRHLKSDQKKWNTFSEETVQLVAEQVKQSPRPTAIELLSLLGGRRQDIAKLLNHDPERQSFFGEFRKLDAYEALDNEKDRPAHYFVKANEYFNKNTPSFITFKGHLFIYSSNSRLKYDDDDEKTFGPDESFKIIHYTGKPIRGLHTITIHHPKMSEDLRKEFFNQLDQYIDRLVKWDPSTEKLDSFLKTAGELAYDTYRFLPFQLGTAAIINWLIRGLALSKGIEIGAEKNIENELPIDWKAFFTETKEKYGEWYKDNAYHIIKAPELKTAVTDEIQENRRTFNM